VHAGQNVFEMLGRIRNGIEWLSATSPNWPGSALAFHDWWQPVLHQLELADGWSQMAEDGFCVFHDLHQRRESARRRHAGRPREYAELRHGAQFLRHAA
jgi:hypothetical protein